MVRNQGAVHPKFRQHLYAEVYKGVAHSYPEIETGSRTGYCAKKWFHITSNNFDGKMDNLLPFRVHVRYTDVLLMYAEAALMAYGIDGSPTDVGATFSAREIMNMIRDRAGVPHIDPSKASVEDFMDELRRDRAVELCYEGHRWMDIRRWKLGTEMKYREKTELIFDRNEEGEPVNFKENILRTKVFEERHYWLPFPKDETLLYEEFYQNPGW
jgi:hypothetical protein